jgi:hypothetical protein
MRKFTLNAKSVEGTKNLRLTARIEDGNLVIAANLKSKKQRLGTVYVRSLCWRMIT